MAPRIREAIRAQEEENEVLISWVQAGLVALLSALYFASPKGFHAGVRALTTKETYGAALQQGYVPAAPRREIRAESVDGVADVIDLVVLSESMADAVEPASAAGVRTAGMS
jgi:hypothetical protein